MPDTKISAMPAVPAAAPTDTFPVVQGGVNMKETNAQVAAAGFVGQTVNASQFSALSTLEAGSGAGSDGVLRILDSGGNIRLQFSTLLGLSQLSIRTSLGVDVGTIDSNGNATFTNSVFSITYGAGGSGTPGVMNIASGLSDTCIVIDGASGTLNLGNGGAAPSGQLIINDSAGPQGVMVAQEDGGMKITAGNLELSGGDPAGFILKSPDGQRWRINVDNAGQLSVNTYP